MGPTPLRAVAALLAGAWLLAGCGGPITRDTKMSDRELAAAGDERMARKEYRGAADHFRVLLEKYPSSPLAERSQVALAEALEEAGEPEQAEEAWGDFLRLHPGSARVPHALYRKGRLAARLAPSEGRDPTRNREALALLQRVSREYPGSPEAPKAAELALEVRRRLAMHEALVVEHYLARKLYAAAAVRAERSAREYEDTAALPVLLSLLARARDGEGRAGEAEAVRRILRDRFPAYEGERKR